MPRGSAYRGPGSFSLGACLSTVVIGSAFWIVIWRIVRATNAPKNAAGLISAATHHPALRHRVHVVYFTALNLARNWSGMISSQLQEAIDSGLAEQADSFDVVLSCSKYKWILHNASAVLDEARSVVEELIPSANISSFDVDMFERYGLLKAWDVARAVPLAERHAHVVLYFHGKGMFFDHTEGFQPHRSAENEWLMAWIVNPWAFIVQRFAEDPLIGTVGECGDATGAQIMSCGCTTLRLPCKRLSLSCLQAYNSTTSGGRERRIWQNAARQRRCGTTGTTTNAGWVRAAGRMPAGRGRQ
jgi:hypothetical protein